MSFEINVMYSSLFDAVFADSFFSPMRTVYVVSDSQLEEIKRKQHQEELDNIEASRKRLESNYQARVKVLADREIELKEKIKDPPYLADAHAIGIRSKPKMPEAILSSALAVLTLKTRKTNEQKP